MAIVLTLLLSLIKIEKSDFKVAPNLSTFPSPEALLGMLDASLRFASRYLSVAL